MIAFRRFAVSILATASVLFLAACQNFYDPARLSEVEIKDRGDWIELSPKGRTPNAVGLVFYPGGFVDAQAYIEPLGKIAAQGTMVVIPRMFLGLAVFDPEKGNRLVSQISGPRRWVIGGHSLGGAMAATAYNKSPSTWSGIFFCAAYPADADDLSKKSVPVRSVSASRDGLATPAKIDATKKLNPGSAVYHVIQGGNHAQFGNYGRQNGDQDATITAEAQWNQIAAQAVDFLSGL